MTQPVSKAEPEHALDALLGQEHLEQRAYVRAYARPGLAEVDAEAERLEAAGNQAALDKLAIETVHRMGEAGLLKLVVCPEDAPLDSRALCVAREEVAWASGMADTLVAMQGLGSYPVALAGLPALRRGVLRDVALGRKIAAFAITEEGAGSDVGGIATEARLDDDDYVLTGAKTYISNAGIADFYVVFARTAPGPKGITAFLVDANLRGLSVPRRIPVNAAHPIGDLQLFEVRVPLAMRLGEEGDGLKLALTTLDRYRPSVGAAALGFAARALDETTARVLRREQFGKKLAEHQATQLKLAEMATLVEASRGLVYGAAHAADHAEGRRTTKDAAMAKLFATESAQTVVDHAVQLHGGLGVTRGNVVERLYREVRALRIYEGTSEIQKLVIARDHLR